MSDVKRLRELEGENAKLKRMYAYLALENAAIKDVLARNVVTPSAKRQAIEVLAAAHRLPIQRACHIVRLSRAAYYRPPVSARRRDAAVIAALLRVVTRYPRWGFWKCFDRLRLHGAPWNHKRVHRVYCALRLNLPRRTKRRVPRRVRQPLVVLPVLNQTWALDFIADALYDRRRFQALPIMDEGNREGLGIDIGRSIPARRVIRVLDEHIALHGRPTALRLDNGPELTADVFVDWCEERQIALHPGFPFCLSRMALLYTRPPPRARNSGRRTIVQLQRLSLSPR